MHSVDHPHPSRQRGPHNDPSMLDGDSAHGNPGDVAGDEWAVDTDTDVVDQAGEDELDDAVADAVADPDTEEVDGVEPAGVSDEVTTGPRAFEEVEDPLPDTEEVIDDEADEVDEADEEAADEAEEEELATDPDAATTTLEEELDRQMDRTSTDPEDPAHHPPQAHVTAPPIDGYDALTVPQVLERADGLDAGQLNAVLEYERANRNRKTLVAKLTKLTRTV